MISLFIDLKKNYSNYGIYSNHTSTFSRVQPKFHKIPLVCPLTFSGGQRLASFRVHVLPFFLFAFRLRRRLNEFSVA